MGRNEENSICNNNEMGKDQRPPEKKVIQRELPEILKTNCTYEPVLVGYSLFATDIQNYIETFIRSRELSHFEAARVFIKKPESSKPELHARCYFKKTTEDIGSKVTIPEMVRERMDAIDNYTPSDKFIRVMSSFVTPGKNYIETYNKEYYSVKLNFLKVLNVMFSVDYHSQEIVVDTAVSKKKGSPLVINVVKQFRPRDEHDGDKFTTMIRRDVERG